MIELGGLTKAYGDMVVVDGISLTIPSGGITSIIGPNGAGKSTLLSMIGRLLKATAGTVSVDGLDVAATPSNTLARRLSVLRQENHITARLTVRDLVTFGRYPHSRGRVTAGDRDKVTAAIDWLGISDLAGRFLDELSGGQRQRAFIAMVLCQETDHVLLDEPLNNLDLKHAVGMMKLIRRAADDLGRTLVVVLHDVNFAAHYSDRIIAMRGGKVVHHGTPDEVVRADILTDIYDVPIAVHELAGTRVVTCFG
ncbi:MAG: ATP-binding cassette domain-containing protein [Bauldia sp.]|nr:ATP-binding cassette domain-containing protein [Bauldia sp.]